MRPTASAAPPEQRPGAFRCPRCRHPCAAHAVFCVGCGLDLTAGTITRAPRKDDDAALPAPTPHLDPGRRAPEKCPGCGEPVAAHYATCRACGAVVKPLSVSGRRPELDEKPRIHCLAGPFVGQSFPLPQRKIIIGRSDTSDISIDATDISRTHASLVPEGDKWRVTDLHSANGTTVNGAEVKTPTELTHGDIVLFGKEHRFRFLHGPDTFPPEPEVAPPPPRPRRRRKDSTTPIIVILAVLVVVVFTVVVVLLMR